MLAMLTCIFASCSDGGSEDPVNPTPKPEEVKAEITIDSGIVSNGLSFDTAQSEQFVSFATNTDWTLSVASTTSGTTWCKASLTSGSKGSANVKFSVEENTEYDERSVSVTIKAGSVSKTFTITQKGVDALLVTTNKYEAAQGGGKIEVEVKANIDYQFVISESAQNWITEVSSRSLTNHKHIFAISACGEEDKRIGEIKFKSGDKEETVYVYQGKSILLLTDNEITVNHEGDTISVELKSNCDFNVQMPDVDWIVDEASSRGLSSHTLRYVVKPNDTYDWRNACIIYSELEGTLKDTLVIWQSQLRGILLSESKVVVKAEGGVIEVPFKTNVDVYTDIDVDWIKRTQAPDGRALSDKDFYFDISPNQMAEAREAQILFKDTWGIAEDTLTVHQEASTNGMSQIIGVWKMTYDDYFLIFNDDKTGVLANGSILNSFKWSMEQKIIKLVYNGSLEEQEWEIRSVEDKALVLYNLNETDPSAINPIRFERLEGDYILTSLNDLTIDAQSQNIDFWVYSNVEVEIAVPDICNWITVNYIVGNNSMYKVLVKENNDGCIRTGTIVIGQKGGELKKTITIMQNQKSLFYISQKEFNVPSDESTIEVELETNIEYEYIIPEKFDWITDYNNNNGKLSFLIKENGDYEKRTGYILFNGKDTEVSDTVYVHQEQNEAIIFKKEEYEVKPEGERIEVELQTNVEFDINVDCEWIKKVGSSSRGLENKKLLFDVEKNVTRETRTGFIKIENKEKLISGTIKVVQDNLNEETKEDVKTFEVNVKTAGSLRELLPDNWSEITTLIIKGYINGDDIDFIRTMAGSAVSVSTGNLKTLDMSGSSIVAGGTYFLIYQTVSNVIGMDMFRECNGIEKIILPNNVTTIDKQAFWACKNLKEVSWGNSVKTIGGNAFGNCDNLTKIGDMSKVEKIDSHAFYDCRSIEKVILGNNLQSIGSSAFYQCYNLTEISIPDKVTEIGGMAFENCIGLNKVVIESGEIGGDAFKGCYNLSSLILRDGITSIENGAFQECSSLKTVAIPNSVKGIGNYAFSNCTSLNSIKLGNGVETLGWYCFENTAITEIDIPDSVIEIAPLSPFSGCTKLRSVVIGNGATSIPSFEKCTNLESIVIGNSVRTIGQSCFKGCHKLNSIVIGENVGSIGKSAFEGCTSLTEVSLGEKVVSIGENAFKQVPLSVLYCYRKNPPMSDSNTPFDKSTIHKNSAKLYVPKGRKDAYENPSSTQYISLKEYFGNIIEME